ncbi:c-type cytochrome [Flavobacterium sp. CYK-4]|uniref:cytochrome-c peroxidase n=1 Tax=Flavobacterium lotistagni TaxID=2709660 RepID=UPI00140ABB37|nr:cytochrome c peroxidase [Flavobacterium lotistagni]NHM06905.1 c-type cytochrome [Flavobacterium lotistagni]
MKMLARNIVLVSFTLLICAAFAYKKTTPLYLEVPKDWPEPAYDFSKNPLTEEGFQLGRHLFYDPIISRDSTISCASCHMQATGFTHVDHELSHGIEGKIGTRNSLALINLAWTKDFLWDGGANHLEVQPLNPITNPVEMDETLEHVVAKLQKTEKYPRMFEAAFGTSKITGQLTLKALTQFMLMLKSSNSKYDKVMRHQESFNPSEQKGYALFRKNCASCHTEPLFSSGKFENNGLAVDATLNDFGRMKITNRTEDSLRFKVPTLRNIQFTFPYMHDGRFKTLTEVVKHYNSIQKTKGIPKELSEPMHLSDNDRTDLVAFMKTLTDTEFLYNPRFSYPK